MNRTVTVILVVVALLLVAFLIFGEPYIASTRERVNAQGFLLNLDRERLEFIKITNGNQVIELKKRDGAWRIIKPVRDTASREVVENIIRAAESLRALDEVSETSAARSGLKLRDFGLSNYKQRLEFGDPKVELLFGKDAAGEKRIYVRFGDSGDMYIVENALQEAAFRSPDEFRDKRLTSLHSDEVSSFVIRRPGGEMELKRNGNRWEIIRPLRCPADPEKVKEFLDQILGAQIVRIVSSDSKPAAELPTDGATRLILRPENGEPETVLEIGAPVADSYLVTALLSSRASVYELSTTVADSLNVTPDAFRDRALLRMNPDVLDRIAIQNKTAEVVFQRKEDDWVGSSNGKEQAVPNRSIIGLLSFLSGVSIERFIPASDADFAKYGLDKPDIILRLQSTLSENTPEEEAGNRDLARIEFGKNEGGKLYARIDGAQEVVVIPADTTAVIESGPGAWSGMPSQKSLTP